MDPGLKHKDLKVDIVWANKTETMSHAKGIQVTNVFFSCSQVNKRINQKIFKYVYVLDVTSNVGISARKTHLDVFLVCCALVAETQTVCQFSVNVKPLPPAANIVFHRTESADLFMCARCLRSIRLAELHLNLVCADRLD